MFAWKTKLKHDGREENIFHLFFSLKVSHFESQKTITVTTSTLWKRLHSNRFNDFNIPVKTPAYLSSRCTLRKGLQAKISQQTSCFCSMFKKRWLVLFFVWLTWVVLTAGVHHWYTRWYSTFGLNMYSGLSDHLSAETFRDISEFYLNYLTSSTIVDLYSQCLMCSKTCKYYLWIEKAQR